MNVRVKPVVVPARKNDLTKDEFGRPLVPLHKQDSSERG